MVVAISKFLGAPPERRSVLARQIDARSTLIDYLLIGMIITIVIAIPPLFCCYMYVVEALSGISSTWPLWTKGAWGLFLYYAVPGFLFYIVHLIREAYCLDPGEDLNEVGTKRI